VQLCTCTSLCSCQLWNKPSSSDQQQWASIMKLCLGACRMLASQCLGNEPLSWCGIQVKFVCSLEFEHNTYSPGYLWNNMNCQEGHLEKKKVPGIKGKIGRSDVCPINSKKRRGLLIYGLVWRIWPLLPARIAVLQCWEKWWTKQRSGCEKTRLKPVLYIADPKNFLMSVDVCLCPADK